MTMMVEVHQRDIRQTSADPRRVRLPPFPIIRRDVPAKPTGHKGRRRPYRSFAAARSARSRSSPGDSPLS